MSLVDQIFEQAKLGTAQDPSANPFATGVQLGQNQQRINQAQQQLAMDLAQAPLQQTLLQQRAQMNALSIEKGLRDNQEEIEGHSLVAQYSKAMQGANLLPLETGVRVHSQFGLDHPAILTNPEYVAAGKQLDERVKQAGLEEARLITAKAREEAAAAASTRAEALRMKAEYETKAKADALPRIVDMGGIPYVYNPGTKKLERLEKTESKASFVEKHALNYSKDNMVSPKEAAELLGKLYDEQIAPLTKSSTNAVVNPAMKSAAPSGASTTPVPSAALPTKPVSAANLKLGTKVVQNGVSYIYRGGDPMDPDSYVPAK